MIADTACAVWESPGSVQSGETWTGMLLQRFLCSKLPS